MIDIDSVLRTGTPSHGSRERKLKNKSIRNDAVVEKLRESKNMVWQ